MAKLIIDLTGSGGLAPDFAGDLNDTTAQPHLRYLGGDSQVADGIYNPLRIAGYMSPANNKFADLTGTITNAFVSRTYDSSSDKIYLPQNGTIMSEVSTLAGTAVSTNFTLPNELSVFQDTEMYEIAGERAIWYSYLNRSTTSDPKLRLGFLTTDTTRGLFTLSAQVYGSGVDDASETINSGSNEKLAQKFSSSDLVENSFTVSGFRFRFQTSGGTSQTWTLRVGIQTDNGSGRPSGSYITGGSVDIDPNTLPQGDYGYVYAALAAPVSLSVATTYHLVVEPTSFGDLSGGEGVAWLRSDGTGGLYPAGQAQQYITGAWANADPSTNEAFDFALVLNKTNNWATAPSVAGVYEIDLEGITTSFIKKADNGFMYWFTEYRVHKIDGGATGGVFGSLTADVLQFPSFLTVVDAVDTNSLMYIAVDSTGGDGGNKTFQADVAGIYEWDRQSTVANARGFLPAYGVREIKKIFVNADGEVRVITIGEDRFTEIRGIVQGRLVVLKRLGLNAYPVRRDSVDTMNNMTVWLGADGIIYAYGKTSVGGKEEVYKIGTINGEVSGALTSGILLTGHESSGASRQGVFLSWTDAGGNTISKWYPHGTGTISSVAQTGNQGDVFSLVKQLPYLATVKQIKITCVPYGVAGDTTTVATLKFYANQSSTPFATKTVTRADIAKGYLAYEINKPYMTSFQMEIEYPTSATLGTNDFCPAYAVLDYEPTTTR